MVLFPVLFLLIQFVICDLNFVLLHTNDMHSRFKQVDRFLGSCKDSSSKTCYGGFARLHEAVQKIRKEAGVRNIRTIFLNAGDNFQGTPYYSMYKWHIVAEFVNALGIDAMSLGNHEFDDGIAGLVPYINHVRVPVICCNIDRSREQEMQVSNLTPSKVFIINGTKVGVIGYLTTSISKEVTGNLTILDEISSIRLEVQRLVQEGVKILIALGHSGYYKDLEIAKEIDEIDLVVGGHTHSFLYTGVPPDTDKPVGPYPTVVKQVSGKQVPVVQAFYGTKYLGHLELSFDDDGNLRKFDGSPILLNGSLPQSTNILKLFPSYDKGLSETHRIVGYTHVFLDNNNQKCQISECNIGNMITDAYVDYALKHCKAAVGWSAAAIGLAQAGGIRTSIDAVTGDRNGSITLEDVMTVIPFGDRIGVIRLNGSVLLEVLEKAVARFELTRSAHVKEFMQVSGLRVIYNVDRMAGNRVVDVKVLCADCKMPRFEPLNRTKIYGVVMTEYLYKGSSQYKMLSGYVAECVSSDVDYVIVSKYIESFSPLNPRIESRITIIHNSPFEALAIVLIVIWLISFSLYFFLGCPIWKSHFRLPYLLLKNVEVHNVLKREELESLCP